MSIFVTADTHFGHTNIIKYCNRPFTSVNDMGKYLINRWNSVVGKDDTVYHLGDVAFMKAEYIISDVLSKLNGTIALVPGNHDKVMRELYTNFVLPFPVVKLPFVMLDKISPLVLNGKKFILCHYPMEDWDDKDKGAIHLHGHSHGNAAKIPGRYDVGVDVYGGPIKLDYDLIELNNPKGW